MNGGDTEIKEGDSILVVEAMKMRPISLQEEDGSINICQGRRYSKGGSIIINSGRLIMSSELSRIFF